MATKSKNAKKSSPKKKSLSSTNRSLPKTSTGSKTLSSNGKKNASSTASLSHSGVPVDSQTWEEMQRVFSAQKKKAIQLRHSTSKERIQKLKDIKEVVYKYQSEVQQALRADFNKSEAETDITEILPTIGECKDAIRHVKHWMKPIRANTPLTLFGAVSEIHYEPKGTTLIISPWNYPFHLAFAPIIAAVAAGNTVILKPSEYTPHTSAITKKMLADIFPEEEVAVFEGDYTVSTALTELPFDHIFFTGSTNVGKIIMERAAKHLTSCTLELGGKSPAILTEGANVKSAAESILWGKFINAGQTCVAPDYLLIPESMVDEFVQAGKTSVAKFFGKNSKSKANGESGDPSFSSESTSDEGLSSSRDFCRIVNSRNFERVKNYIDDAVSLGAKIEMGGSTNPEDNFIEPTILSHVSMESKIMEDEIFGPLLPIVPYQNLDEAIDFINSKPKPLALYVFSRSGDLTRKVLKSTSSGGAVVNDVIIHLANSNLPFGGVNHSGHGSYHGHFGFREFSHEKSVLKQAPLSSVKLMYPTYTNFVRKLVDATTKYLM